MPIPEGPALKMPRTQPWYGKYHLRFDTSRRDGSRISNEGVFTALSATAAEATLRELLGPGRYDVSLLGIEEIPFTQWPAECRLECGIDLRGQPLPAEAPQSGSAAHGAPAKSRPRPAKPNA